MNDTDMKKIEDLIVARDEAESAVDASIRAFLIRLDKAGGFAPTVKQVYGGGSDTIEEITMNADGTICLSCENYFRGSTDYYDLTFSASLINEANDEAIVAFVTEGKRLKEERKADDEAKRRFATEAQERETLARLAKKYPSA